MLEPREGNQVESPPAGAVAFGKDHGTYVVPCREEAEGKIACPLSPAFWSQRTENWTKLIPSKMRR